MNNEDEKQPEKAKPPKSFEDLGLTFVGGSGCKTCMDEGCHNQVTRKSDGNEYSVHISRNGDHSLFWIYAAEQANTDSGSTIDQEFDVEEDAVNFVCSTFNGFKCF